MKFHGREKVINSDKNKSPDLTFPDLNMYTIAQKRLDIFCDKILSQFLTKCFEPKTNVTKKVNGGQMSNDVRTPK